MAFRRRPLSGPPKTRKQISTSAELSAQARKVTQNSPPGHKGLAQNSREGKKPRKFRLTDSHGRRGRHRRIETRAALAGSKHIQRKLGFLREQGVWHKFTKSRSQQDLEHVCGEVDWKLGGYHDEPGRLRTRFVEILEILKDANFPKQKEEAQIRFIADSLGAEGLVSPRRSRDIVQKERRRLNGANVIFSLRRAYEMKCSCGWTWTSADIQCPKCGTTEFDLFYKAPRMGRPSEASAPQGIRTTSVFNALSPSLKSVTSVRKSRTSSSISLGSSSRKSSSRKSSDNAAVARSERL